VQRKRLELELEESEQARREAVEKLEKKELEL
jgi:hypothetical protein